MNNEREKIFMMNKDNQKDSLEGEFLLAPEETEEKFEEKMKELASREEERQAKASAARARIPYIYLASFPISAESISLLSPSDAKLLGAIAFFYSGRGGEIRLAITDSKNSDLASFIKKLEDEHDARVHLYFISRHSFEIAFRCYEHVPRKSEILKGVKITEKELIKFRPLLGDFRELQQHLYKQSTTEMVTIIIGGAIEANASDIHIEAEDEDVKIRYRLDGILHDVAILPKEKWKQIVSRIKLLSSLKLNIVSTPQDGRFTIFLEKEEIDVRVSTVPTTYGESIVMRLLMSSAILVELEDLGLRGEAKERLQNEINKPNGMVIATGPTGSGKTTTLYAVLRKLNTEETKIMTLENPIEYKLKGVNQSQVNSETNYDFAKGLRSTLRQDPDVIMVGEIRDFETADTAINAALTGHLVLSTIHTNSASGAIPRFLSMGVKPFLLSPALNAIIGQRLVRKICSSCKEQDLEISEEKIKKAREILESIPKDSKDRPDIPEHLIFFRGAGCESCHGLGYKGRIGIFEIMIMNEEVNDLIADGKVSEYELQAATIKYGMVTMMQDGMMKVLLGVTSLDEVFRVAD